LRVAIAMFWHEGNSFSPVPTDMPSFRAGGWARGEEVRALYAGTSSEMGGALAFLDAHPEHEGHFLRVAWAGPAGPVPHGVYETIRDEILDGLARPPAGGWDAVYLALHGAMVTDTDPLPDLHLIERVRARIGPSVRLGVSFDLHANLDPRIAGLVDFATAYRTHSHVDQDVTARRVLSVLARSVEAGLRPAGHIAKVNAILPSINMRTAEGPMAECEAFARGLEAAGILDASVLGGFSYGDTPAAGASAMAFDPDPARARQAAEALRDAIAARRDRFTIRLPSAEAGVRAAIEGGRFPVAVTDPGDNPDSGGIGDTPELLRAVVALRPDLPVVFIFFHDPDLVRRAIAAGPGAVIEGTLGGRITDAYGPPVPFTARVERLTDGVFAAIGPMLHGVRVDYGPTALLRFTGQDLRVIVTSRCRSPNDPGLLKLHGIEIGEVGILCAKAKNHFRPGYLPLVTGIIDTDAPGPAALDIASFRFRHAPPGIHPLGGGADAKDA
jgi:microcystin degradation protein MlrC